MTTPTLSNAGAAALMTDSQPKPTKAKDAAQQFEALLIGQMLRSAHEASQDADADSSGETMLDLANQQFSQVLAKNGGMGLANLIVKGLQK